jgi:hypothetical protein
LSACVGEEVAAEEGAAVGVPGDFDRDGKLDLATANSDGSVSVFRGDGEGCLVSKVTYATNLESDVYWWDLPPVIVAVDLDGNGTDDLVTTNPDAKAVAVLLGGFDGSFELADTYPLEDYILGVAVVDWDADDVNDLVVATTLEDMVTVLSLRGTGGGRFANPSVVWVGRGYGGFNVADLNRDDLPDVILAGSRVFLHQPDGTLLENGSNPLIAGASSVSVDDLDRDGDLDIVVVSQCTRGAPEGIDVLLGVGDGTFAESRVHPGGCARNEPIATALVTRDDAVDLVRFPDSVLLGAGDGTFLPEPVSTPQDLYASLLALGDWNHDGLPDVAVVTEEGVAVRAGDGEGRFVTAEQFAP